jgi:hypothetical protein
MPRPSRPRGTPAGPGNDDNDDGTSDDDDDDDESGAGGDEAGPGVSLACGSVVTRPTYPGNLPVGEGVSGS